MVIAEPTEKNIIRICIVMPFVFEIYTPIHSELCIRLKGSPHTHQCKEIQHRKMCCIFRKAFYFQLSEIVSEKLNGVVAKG